ncbi:MAG: hypothetical protein ACYC9Q_09125 [Bacillota bacterium]
MNGETKPDGSTTTALDLLHKVEKPAIHNVALPAAIRDQIEATKIKVAAVYKLMEEILQPGVDYDIIKGTDKPTLLKPGAEILAQAFNLTEEYSVLLHTMELDRTPPFIKWSVQCDLYHRDTENHVGQGVGAANSYEDKHRWRWQGKGEERHRVENAETMTLDNTLLKMAKKRAFVDAVLTVTGASRLFTQDLEDLGLDQDEDDRKASPNQLDFLRKMGAVKKGLRDDLAILSWAKGQLRKDVSALGNLSRDDASTLLDILLGKTVAGETKASPTGEPGGSAPTGDDAPPKSETRKPSGRKTKTDLYPVGQQPVADGQYEVVEAPQSKNDDSRGLYATCKVRVVSKVNEDSPVKVGDTCVFWTSPGDQNTHDALMKASMGSVINVKGLLADTKGNIKVTEVKAAQAPAPAAKSDGNTHHGTASAPQAPPTAPAADPSEGGQELAADFKVKKAVQVITTERGPVAYVMGALQNGILGSVKEAPKGDYQVWGLTPLNVAKLKALRVGQTFGVIGVLRSNTKTNKADNVRADEITVYEAQAA